MADEDKRDMGTDSEAVLKRARDYFRGCVQAEGENYTNMLEDLNFANGDQWPRNIEARRIADDRPCLRINKMPKFVDRVVGEVTQSMPRIKIIAVDSKSDIKTAEMYGGLIRNIENQSDADVAYKTGAKGASKCGFGAWRVDTEYCDDETWDQRIRINRIKNQFTVYLDPMATRMDRSDGRFAFVTELLTREQYREQFPNSSLTQWDHDRDNAYVDWIKEDTIRVSEYWEKVPDKKTLYLYQIRGENEPITGTELPEGEEGRDYTILKQRDVDTYKIMWYRLNGAEILEGPVEKPGKYIPIVPCYGKETIIENKTWYHGVVRHAKDSQRLYNYFRSMAAEIIALAPRQPYLVTPKQIQGFEEIWRTAQDRNFSYLPVNPDPQVQGVWPKREPPQMVSSATQNEIMIADAELNDTTAMPEATLGEKSNERSGKAVNARAELGSIGQYEYTDNLRYAIRYTGRILLDLIPHIYDTERIERILNEDGTEEFITLNPEQKDEAYLQTSKYMDVTVGKYDIVVVTGPSYQTQRQEGRDGMIELYQMYPDAAPVTADLLVKNSDWPGNEEIAKRLRKMLPPQVLDPEDQPPPSPADQQAMKLAALEETLKEIEAETKQAQLEQEKIEVEIQRAKLAQEEAKAAQEEKEAVRMVNDEDVDNQPKKAASG